MPEPLHDPILLAIPSDESRSRGWHVPNLASVMLN